MSLNVTSMAQAGFLFEAGATRIGLDLYLSDCCERLVGFKRLIPAPARGEELELDWLIATHPHWDHLDVDLLPVAAANPKTRFIGSRDCRADYERCGIAPERFTLLEPGDVFQAGDFRLEAVSADHGDAAPDALGFFMTAGGVTLYVAGDTCFNPELLLGQAGGRAIDAMIAPVNGAYGNLNRLEAARLANLLRPKMLIASHFGMFAEHDGDAGTSWEEMRRELDPAIALTVPATGQQLVF